jgi:hypothetical protein
MGYKPTLGGLKKAQKFLSSKGYPMPIFQMNIYDDGKETDSRWKPGKGRTISIDEAIRKYGAMYEVVDVRLTNNKRDKSIQFSDKSHFDIMTAIAAIDDGYDALPEFNYGKPIDYRFKDFMASNNTVFLILSRWGKKTISILDRIKFRLFPESYATKVFA